MAKKRAKRVKRVYRWVPKRNTLGDKMIQFLSRPRGATHPEVQDEFHIKDPFEARAIMWNIVNQTYFKAGNGRVFKYKFKSTKVPENQRKKRGGRTQLKVINGPYVKRVA